MRLSARTYRLVLGPITAAALAACGSNVSPTDGGTESGLRDTTSRTDTVTAADAPPTDGTTSGGDTGTTGGDTGTGGDTRTGADTSTPRDVVMGGDGPASDT